MIAYTPQFQREASKELDYVRNTGIAPHLEAMIVDYGTTRDTIRACK